MTDGRGFPRALSGAAFGFGVIAATFYFAHAALQGESGMVEQVRLAREEAELSRELDALQGRRREIETLTRRLSDTSLDLDLLDERARTVLGMARPDEIVIR